jgi:transcription initiation factor TFIIA small subunit
MTESHIHLYRSSILCDFLMETLEELADEQKISQDLANKVLESFDTSCLDALRKRAAAKGQLTGKLNTYNYFDSVWQFEVCDAVFKLAPKAQGAMASAPRITADKIKLICVDARLCQSTE